MQKRYALIRMHAINIAACPYISLHLFSYKITLMKINNPDCKLRTVLG